MQAGTHSNRARRTAGVLAAIAVVAGGFLASASAAAAGDHVQGGTPGDGPVKVGVGNPGEVVLELTGGLISVNDGEAGFDLGESPDPDAEPGDPVTLTGTVNQDGTFHIPAENVLFPDVDLPDEGVTVSIGASQDVTGHINLFNGAMTADLNLAIAIDTGFLAVCTLNLPMELSTDIEGGVPYARKGKAAGTVTVGDDSFAIPNTTPSGLLGPIACPQVNQAFGLPAPAGTNLALIEFASDPVLEMTMLSPGHEVMNAERCETELGGVWSTDTGVATCTTETAVSEFEQTGFIQTGTSGTNRWRAQILVTTTTFFELHDSQQGNVGALGTSETHEQEVGDELGQEVTYEVAVCQQGPTLGSTFQNRPLDSPRCVEILEDFIAAQEEG